MNTAQINRIVDRAYAQLNALNEISLTRYRDRCFDMAIAEERGHRRCKPTGLAPYPKGASVPAAARLFVVKRIAEYLTMPGTEKDRPTIADVLHLQPSAIYAASIVANYGAEIMRAWTGLDMARLATLDYVEFVNDGSK